ncbi:MAG: hypothetical protein JF623_06635, partial [Acidobacteria bacterium]|nr:hypothetical protein [Acidobacteriota bacterium]
MTGVAATELEQCPPFDCDPDRPEGDERERERRDREGEEMARAPERSLRPEGACRQMEDAAEEEVRDEPVEAAGEEDDDRDDDRVARGIVQQVVHRRRSEHGGHPRKPHEREDRLLARLQVLVGIVAQRGEHRA